MSFVFKTLPVCLLVLAAALAPRPGAAQERDWVNPDVNALREEVATLQRQVAALRGEPLPGGAGGEVGAGAVALGAGTAGLDRLGRIENALRQLTGQVEELDYRQRQTIAGLTRRLVALESQAGITPPVEPQAAAASVTTPGRGAPPTSLGEIPIGGPGAAASAAATAGAVNPLGPEPDAPAEPLPVGPSADEASYQNALDALRGRSYDDAEKLFRGFIEANPRDSRVGDATYWLGESHYLRGQFDAAAEVFLGGFRAYPQASRAPDMLFRLGMTFVRRQQLTEACMTFKEVRARYPNAPARTLKRTDIEAQRAGCT